MTKVSSSPNLSDDLSKRTVIFGLHLWVIIGICVGAAFVLLLFLISLWLASRRTSSSSKLPIPTVSKEILEVSTVPSDPKSLAQILQKPLSESNRSPVSVEKQALLLSREEDCPAGINRIHIEIGKDHRITYPECGGGENRSGEQLVAIVAPEVSHLGWGHWFTLRELEVATNMFTDENVIGEGGYGIVYHGVLTDNTHIAVKNLLNNRGQAEREFKVEVEAIGRVRHKNLVRLLGYCAEGAHRMLVYEYVDNGNLEQWLHGDVGPISPLTWEIRMEIILGTAKGYVAPEYASTGMLNERSDVYSFGILIMEIISGRNPVDYSRPQGEVNLVDWLKMMVSSRKSEAVLDPKVAEKPSSRALKRALLVALRCVDPDAQKRPKMGHVIHMLEVDDFPYRDDRRGRRVCRDPQEKAGLIEDLVAESSDGGKLQSTPHVDKPQ
ncbi:probable serine/threonine-protein kinase At1g01540 isoform X2 [Phalaenopsis equestris]|uniref:probable serine/threonine-protein kinase At1g01540 isoform X2 n=1 Tax=Phalaenopsis equestris TaxID=78828 RepID=UPI0009E1A04C|nr:probable serine/threonine-protein kinase At1g01540 isoform X2 [Phalaenopsis equestris]